MANIITEVLIIGTGPAGSTSAALLSSYGVENVVINRYHWLANTPRAHITNQRTMEVLRDLGKEVEAEVYLNSNAATPHDAHCCGRVRPREARRRGAMREARNETRTDTRGNTKKGNTRRTHAQYCRDTHSRRGGGWEVTGGSTFHTEPRSRALFQSRASDPARIRA